jgi:OPA family glycerol-3-phosphate transporter-like MFS transporter
MKQNFRLVYGLCLFIYTGAYFGRVNFSIALPYLQDALDYSKGRLGIVASGFFVAYAVGQLINGILGDRFHPRLFMGIGLLIAGISNIILGMVSTLPIMVILWALNGYFQSMLWGPLVRLVTDLVPPNSLQKLMLPLAATPVLGYFLAYTLLGRLIALADWRATFVIPGVFLVVMAIFWYWGLKGYTTKPSSTPAQNESRNVPQNLPTFILSKRLWVFVLLCVPEGAVKEGLNLWGITLFAESQSMTMEKVLFIMSIMPIANLLAIGLSAGINKKFCYIEKHTLIFFAVVAIIFAAMLYISMNSGVHLMSIAFCGMLASSFAINNLLTAFVPLNFRQEGRISTVAGMMDCSVYLGAAISGPVTGFVADHSGWTGVSICWIFLSVLTLVITFFTQKYKK